MGVPPLSTYKLFLVSNDVFAVAVTTDALRLWHDVTSLAESQFGTSTRLEDSNGVVNAGSLIHERDHAVLPDAHLVKDGTCVLVDEATEGEAVVLDSGLGLVFDVSHQIGDGRSGFRSLVRHLFLFLLCPRKFLDFLGSLLQLSDTLF